MDVTSDGLDALSTSMDHGKANQDLDLRPDLDRRGSPDRGRRLGIDDDGNSPEFRLELWILFLGTVDPVPWGCGSCSLGLWILFPGAVDPVPWELFPGAIG